MDTPSPEPESPPPELPAAAAKKPASTSIWLILLGALVLIPGLCFGVASPLHLGGLTILLAVIWVIVLFGTLMAALIAGLGALFGGNKGGSGGGAAGTPG